jgi:adenine phosphoribosyltransferase
MDPAALIAKIPDFPTPGVLFYDISPLLADVQAWRATIEQLTALIRPFQPDVLVCVESRGFLLVSPLALALNVGFTMVRKSGKLPGQTMKLRYNLEYGTDFLEIQLNSIKPNQRVVIVDDLLATGGTVAATAELVKKMQGQVVGLGCLIELRHLQGRNRLNFPVTTLLTF